MSAHSHAFDPGHSAATLSDGSVITSDDVERFVAGGRGSGIRPGAGTPAGRQLRRWALQVLLTEYVAERAWRAAGEPADPGVDQIGSPVRLRCEIGSICATALFRSSATRGLMASRLVTADPADLHAAMVGRQQFELDLRREVAAVAELSEGWHHPGDARFPEAAHSH